MPPNNAQRRFAYQIAKENITDSRKLREVKTFIYGSRLDKLKLDQLVRRWGKELPSNTSAPSADTDTNPPPTAPNQE